MLIKLSMTDDMLPEVQDIDDAFKIWEVFEKHA
jgi:hypothetical protein